MSKASIAVAPVQLNVGDGASVPSPSVTFAEVVTAVRENIGRILSTAALAALAAGSLAAVLPRSYESSTRILIDPRGISVLEKDLVAKGNSAEQATMLVESEMRVLYSDNVLRTIVEREKLADDPEFNGEGQTLARLAERVRAFTKSLIGIDEEATPRDLAALRYLQRAVKVRREPQSYVIDLSVSTRNSGRSQALADQIAAEYVKTRFQAVSLATQRASDAMGGRLDELKRAVVTAEDAVERYKAQNNIVGASGRLVNEQQLAELNSQLVVARNDAAKAAELMDQVARLRRAGLEADSLPEALRSETLSRLRSQYAAIRRREASASATVLASHPAMKQIQRELADTKRLISDELGRIADNARLEAERARTNERTLERNFEELKALASSTNERIVRMRQLEREAEANRAVYNAFLQRARELPEMGRVDTVLATVLSPAILPRGPKAPTLLHLLAFGGLGGLGLGLFGSVRRLRADPRLRGEEHLRQIVGSRRFLAVPKLADAVRRYRRITSGSVGTSASDVPLFVTTNADAPAAMAVVRAAAVLGSRTPGGAPQILLFTAAGDFEGKSTVAANIALAAAAAGDHVLLIDADLHERSLSKMLRNGDALPGFSDVIAGRAEAHSVIVKRAAYPIDILPAGIPGDLKAGLVSRAIPNLAVGYDVVVIDGGVPMRDRFVFELGLAATQIALIAREGVTLKEDYRSAFEALDRGGKVRPMLLTDA